MANDIIIQQVRELKSLKIMAKELADEIAKLETSLKNEMESRQTEKMTIDVFTLSYITVVTHRIDTTAIKKELLTLPPATTENHPVNDSQSHSFLERARRLSFSTLPPQILR